MKAGFVLRPEENETQSILANADAKADHVLDALLHTHDTRQKDEIITRCEERC